MYKCPRHYVCTDNLKSKEFITKECRRYGDVLGLTLFVVLMDDIIKEMKTIVKKLNVGYRNLAVMGITERGNKCW